jgi:hypothetical protein
LQHHVVVDAAAAEDAVAGIERCAEVEAIAPVAAGRDVATTDVESEEFIEIRALVAAHQDIGVGSAAQHARLRPLGIDEVRGVEIADPDRIVADDRDPADLDAELDKAVEAAAPVNCSKEVTPP